MSQFDLDQTLERARRRLSRSRRRPRSDRGVSRLDPRVLDRLHGLLSGQEKPRMRHVLADLREFCRDSGLEPPSRATVYRLMDRATVRRRRVADLPSSVRSALYNLDADTEVPEHQIAFSCANYGDLRAMSFAAGLPWLAIHQALRLRGHRPKSRGILEAIARARRI